jgi:hypothetical protein
MRRKLRVYKRKRTDESDDVNFLTILTLEARSDPAVCTNVRHASDPSEHVTRDHDERCGDGSQSPCPTRLKNGRSETKDEEKAKAKDRIENDASPVDGFAVGNFDGGMPRKGFGEWSCTEASRESERMSMRVGKGDKDILVKIVFGRDREGRLAIAFGGRPGKDYRCGYEAKLRGVRS